ncbi:hypothetical protein [Streptomyces soliscabiei]|uniref:hypothetical protein n=1 Tax=Streptomyces soliscabiei TaxID=588897 RepID=UPI0029A5C739|nr:hypothetical protein [Streptomyces sp. NY05-11A]MDX2676778.1 hypothetical protein [Streptomyces sp. NY05-11A]
MSGSGDDWLIGGLDDITGVESGLWVRGVDYMAGWRAARESADRMNRALLGAGFELSEVRAIASTDTEGRGVVRLVSSPDAVGRLAALLEALADGDGGVR